jgi:hypothetical protein
MARWPYSFALDDLDIQGCIFVAPLEKPLLDAGDRVTGVYVLHRPSGEGIVMTAAETRDENLQMALRRLDRMLLRAAR